jgi:hypothetical protein
MAELVLVRFDESRSADQRRALLRRLRETARSIIAKSARGGEVGTIGGGRFRISYRGSEGSVDPDGALFDLDEADFAIVRLIYELAKAGGMVWVDAWAPSSTILFDAAQRESVPPEFRRPRPALCTSAEHLARMLGVSTTPKAPAPRPAKLHEKHRWSHQHENRSRARLPGLHADPKRRYIYVQVKPGEGADLLMKQLAAFIRAGKKQKKLTEPAGGGIFCDHSDDWELRLPGGDVFIPLHVTGYGHRPNTDHLIPANIEAWLAIARDFGRQSNRRTATIAGGKTLVLDSGRRYRLAQAESRRTPEPG